VNSGLALVPEGVRVFVLSRNEPPAAFTRLRANSAVQAVGWNELRFTLEESERITRLSAKRRLTEEALAELHRRTEGWAAGLVLMMEGAGTRMQGMPPAGKGAQKEVFDYFAGEVFDKLDSETRDFLLMTAFLPSMTAG
jgi:ATP/maltotriose-dependent transcriptional regulator MalT